MGATIHDIQEEAVVRGCVQDDADATEAFCRTFRPRLIRVLKRRLDDDGLAEDLSQEALIKALRGLDGFDPTRPLWPWLRTIALNLAIDHTRKGDPEVPCRDIYRSSRDPLEQTDESLLLDQALRSLPGRHRAALSLRYLNDWKPTEAAQFLGMSRPAFDQLLSRAKRRLSIEYRRMSSGVQAIILLQTQHLKTMFRGGPSRAARRLHLAADLPPSLITSLSHVLAASAVVITAVATPAGTDVPRGGGSDGAHPMAESPLADPSTDPRRGHGRNGPPVASAGAASTAPAQRSNGGTSEPKQLDDKVGDIVDPTKNVDEPEDASFTSFAFGDDGEVVYAAGKTDCRLATCPPVLFRSEDGGATWERVAARGFDGSELAIPQGSRSDDVLFAMGPTGLQVSRDGGESFGPAVVSGTPLIMGSMAVSPEFHHGDPTVLVGSDTLLRYSDSTGVMDPYVSSLNGPFEPAFSPGYESTGLFYLGAVKTGEAKGMRSAVYSCNAHGCVFNALPEQDLLPKIRTVETDPSLVYAFTVDGLFVSRDRTVHFSRLAMPWSAPKVRLLDLESLGPAGHLLAAGASLEASGDDGLYRTADGGITWSQNHDSLFDPGVTGIDTQGTRVMVALRDGGIACSGDGGKTFARRCTAG